MALCSFLETRFRPKNIKNSFSTKKKLQKQIAIPILLKQSLSKYNTIAKKIAYLLA